MPDLELSLACLDYFHVRALMQGRVTAEGIRLIIAEHVGRSTTFKSAISVSDTGTIAYAGTLLQKGTLTWFDRTGQRVNSMAPEGSYSDFRLSPDEKLLAASMLDDKTGNIDIWMTDLARGARSRVTADGAFNSSRIWSPDSAQLLFRTFQKGASFVRKAPLEEEGNRQCCRTGPFRPFWDSNKQHAYRHRLVARRQEHPFHRRKSEFRVGCVGAASDR